MFDPSTVAHEIKYPWRSGGCDFDPKGYRHTFITIWHQDPCTDGSDDSCDWSGWKRKLNAKEMAIVKEIRSMESILDNRPFYPDHPAHLRFQTLKRAVDVWRERSKFRIHPRWHIWHWRIQIHPLQKFNRWLFSRCYRCKGGFGWNESVMGSWDGDLIWHFRCDESGKPSAPITHKSAMGDE